MWWLLASPLEGETERGLPSVVPPVPYFFVVKVVLIVISSLINTITTIN